ncbi:Methyltransferase domain family protein [Rhodobacteraceae bacterium KLH11]|nr:Methyltransferase domain family protein [Rhodobacteraceae bacterium KLH11]
MKKFTGKPDWSTYEKNWLDNYDASNYGSSLSSHILRSTHNLIENNASLNDHYDTKVIGWLTKQDWHSRVEIKQLSGATLPFADDSIDRVIATHVLEHILDPVTALTEWVRVIRTGGVLSPILPSDPGFAWRIGRLFGPRKRGYAAGLPYDYYMSVEHVDAIHNLHHIIKFHFPDRYTKWWPMRAPIPDINLVYGVNCFV